MTFYLETPEGDFLAKVNIRPSRLKKQFNCDIQDNIAVVYAVKKRRSNHVRHEKSNRN